MLCEGENLEFKREFVKDVVKTVISFGNSSGGVIYFGINDLGEYVGLDNPDEVMLQLTNTIRDSIFPDIIPFTSVSLEVVEGKNIVTCQVQKGTSSPYYLKSKGLRPEGVFVRHGASSVPASQSAIVKMIKETDGDNYEELRSLNQKLTFKNLKEEFKNAKLPLEKPHFRTLNIIDQDDHFTNLGLLLSDQCDHTIKAAVFEGDNKGHFKDRYEFSGSLLKQMRELYAFIDRYNRTNSFISGLNRVDSRDYSSEVVREAILNAIVHKDYGYGSSTLVSLFDNEIEILSIGGLVKGFTKDDILIGASVLRNKNLANVFYRLKLIEAYGTGLLKIFSHYENLDQKPTLKITDNAFKITLPSDHYFRRKEDVVLNSSEQHILEILQEQEVINRKDVEEALAISQAMAIKLLKSLLNKKLLRKSGSGKNIFYSLRVH